MRSKLLAAMLISLPIMPALAAELPEGYWDAAKAAPILEKTVTLRLAPDLSGLSENEKTAIGELLAAGRILHRLYLEQNHHQALDALAKLRDLHKAGDAAEQVESLATLFRLFKGPVATTLDNDRVPFLPVDAEVPGRNMYPRGVDADALERYASEHPDAQLLGDRTLVRRATRDNLSRDLDMLKRHAALDALHPGLRARLESTEADEDAFYAVPYAVAWGDRLMRVYAHLRSAADAMRAEDPDFSAYLENRARDLLANDYEAGDASWVSGDFGRLNAQIGSYETYDDELFGVKTFFSLSLLARDEKRSAEVAEAIGDLQAIENDLPYSRHRKVRADIPIGVYNVIADFGQSRGTNTATILPNDADHTRKYGRIILLRYNIMTNPELFEDTKAAWSAALASEFDDDLTLEGGFQRTLWHEIGHYLGVANDERGRPLDAALQAYSDLLEEMKADLVSLHAARGLHESGYYTANELRALYADGVRRTLQKVKPRREQPYQTMQLMQMNWFLEHGLLDVNDAGELVIDYARYHDVVRSLLAEVLAIQSAGDPDRAAAFVERYATWDDGIHGVIAKRMRDAAKYRYRLVRYEALGE